MNAAGEYIGNAIQEMMVVKKTAEVPRVLPSLNHMKVVSIYIYIFRKVGNLTIQRVN